MAVKAQRLAHSFHFWATILLAAALIPCLKRLHLPLAFDWVRLASAYWLVLAAQSVFLAALLFVIAMPWNQGLGTLLERLMRDKLRIPLIVICFCLLLIASTWMKALILTVVVIALLEFWERTQPPQRREAIPAILAPALYLFAGFLLVFAYNDIIMSVRFFGATDAAFNAADRWLLRGLTVSEISHWALRVFPVSFFHFLDFIYFGMFPQVGAGLLISSLNSGKARGLQFVGAILTAYYIALLLAFTWPSQGPYYLCPTHLAQFPRTLQTYAAQMHSVLKCEALWKRAPIARISTDYYIAFPCMHLTQPLIVMWFLRRWKPMVAVLAVYNVVLFAAILLLEWHYLVDILASAPLAAVAIASVDGKEFWRWITRRESGTVFHNSAPVIGS